MLYIAVVFELGATASSYIYCSLANGCETHEQSFETAFVGSCHEAVACEFLLRLGVLFSGEQCILSTSVHFDDPPELS